MLSKNRARERALITVEGRPLGAILEGICK